METRGTLSKENSTLSPSSSNQLFCLQSPVQCQFNAPCFREVVGEKASDDTSIQHEYYTLVVEQKVKMSAVQTGLSKGVQSFARDLAALGNCGCISGEAHL